MENSKSLFFCKIRKATEKSVLELPILYIGTGEQPENLVVFDKYEFVDGLLDALFVEEE